MFDFTLIKALINRMICDALRDLVPFIQIKKREKHPWRGVTFSKVAGGLNLKIMECVCVRARGRGGQFLKSRFWYVRLLPLNFSQPLVIAIAC